MKTYRFFRTFPLLAAVAVTACATSDPLPPEQGPAISGAPAPPEGRREGPRALHVGSCQGACGGKSLSGLCWCDDSCSQYGDCCKDKATACPGEEPPTPCGATTCAPGLECCNPSCGLCVPPGGACIELACGPVDSCVDSCGGKSKSGACWCDDGCAAYGDCCADKASTCDPPDCPDVCPQICAGEDVPVLPAECPVPSCDCDEKVLCGGFAGLPCPEGLHCFDDPEDDCDPANGGADCGGVCLPPPPDSCLDHCGGASEDQSCYCDDLCDDYGDCCSDFEPVCSVGVAPRTPVSGGCAKNAGHTCNSDADCTNGGCGGETCYNPAGGPVITTCECTAPNTATGCGCVEGLCSWYQ